MKGAEDQFDVEFNKLNCIPCMEEVEKNFNDARKIGLDFYNNKANAKENKEDYLDLQARFEKRL